MNLPTPAGHDDAHRSDTRSALLIGVASVLLLVGISHHPTAHSHDAREMFAEIGRLSVLNGAVHGGLLIVMLALFAALLGFSARLGWSSTRVRAGAVFYGASVVCMMAAALIDGFVLTRIAAGHEGASDAEVQSLVPIFRTWFDVNQVAAMAGIVASSIAILCWSLVLVGRGSLARAIAVLGFLAAALCTWMLWRSGARINLHVMGAVLLFQVVWNVAVAIWLWRARPG